MKEHNCAQGEADWLTVRLGKVTASEADALLTPEFKPRTGETPHTYLCRKIAEKLRGKPLPVFQTFAMEQGQLLEMEARKWFAFETDHAIRNVGFIEADDGRSGCSPDALLDNDGGLELKCPQDVNHVKYLLSGELPKEYEVQVHFSMYATGRNWWQFVSYRRGLPPLTVKVPRDEMKITAIRAALTRFYDAFDLAEKSIAKKCL